MPFDRPKVGTTDNDTLRAMPVVLVDTAGEYAGAGAGGSTGTSASQVQGNVADGVADAGNPVEVGGQYVATAPTLTDGVRSRLYVTNKGALKISLESSAGVANLTRPDNADAAPVTALLSSISVSSRGTYFNGATWDRVRGDVSGAFTKAPPLAGTDRSITATTTSAQLMAANATRSKFIIKNDTAIDVWITFGATAAATPGSGNIKIAAGAFFEMTGTSAAVQIIAASTTAAITAREF